jgi:nucleoside-diphosphate-sugar epimerase
MRTEDSTILVTGVTGFVGRHLAVELARCGWRVRGATRRNSCNPQQGVEEWAMIDEVGPETEWSEALRNVTTVIHLAALAHCTDPKRRPSDDAFMEINARGTRRLAESAVQNGGVRRFIYLSSIGAVAETSEALVDEDAHPTPISPYGRSKLAGERAISETFSNSSVEWSVLRPVLVYGPGNPGNMHRLLRLVRSGFPLPFNGIRNRRNFVFVGNLVSAIERLTAAREMSGRVFNVADDETVSTPELIRMIASAAGKRARLWTAPIWLLDLAARCGDAAAGVGLHTGIDSYSLNRLETSLTASNQALTAATGWRPRVSLTEGICATLSFTSERSF